MKIDTTKLKENIIESFSETISPQELDLDSDSIKYKGSITISSQVKKDNQIIYVKSHFAATAQYVCSRCLKECVDPIEKDFDLAYSLERLERFIDASKDIRGEIILSYPVKLLCKPDCRGLCPKCGKDLNEDTCGCQMRP